MIIKNKMGISVMQDAIIFCIMVSISAAILLPTLLGGVMKEAHSEKELEERVNEELFSFLITRKDEFNYQVGEAVLSILGEQITSSFIYDSIDPLISTNYLIHQSFANLIADCLACQLSIFGYTINPIATAYKESLREEIKEFFDERFGKRIMYNLTAEWQPVYLAPIGSKLCVGYHPPEEKFTSEATIIMPFSLHEKLLTKSQLYEVFQENLIHIEENVTAYKNNVYSKAEALQNISNELVYMCREFLIGSDKDFTSVANLTILYCFNDASFNATSADIFNNFLKEITGENIFLKNCIDVFNDSLDKFYDVLIAYDASIADQYYEDIDNAGNIEEKIYALQNCTWKIIQKEIFEKNAYQHYIEEEAQELLSSFNIQKDAIDFIYSFCNLYRARISLQIWRA